MDFAHPRWLWLLAMLPLLAGIVAWAARRRLAGWRSIALPGRPPGDGGVAWLVAMTMLVVALAQPRWGRGQGEPLPRGRDVVLLIDVSWSMAAEDVVPDRLGRAIEAAEGLTRALGREPGDRVAVVAFAGRGVIRCPLTANLGAVVESLRALRPGAVEPGGSDLGAGLDAAIDALDDEPRAGGRIVVVLSDGEDHVPEWPSRVDRLRGLGVVVHAVALGEAGKGHPIPIFGRGEGGALTIDDSAVETTRIDTELRGLALATGGAFVPLGVASADLETLYDRQIAPAERRSRAVLTPTSRVERFGLFLLAGMAVGLIGSWPRPPRPSNGRRRWWASLLILGVASSAIGAGGDRDEAAAVAVAEGRLAFDRGELDAALDRFEHAAALAPGDPIPPYNLAATLYQLGRFEEARDRYLVSRDRADAGLRTKIDYALGNTAVALRDLPAALRHYDDCIASTVSGPTFDLIRRYARDNRTFAERLANPDASSIGGDDSNAPGDGDPGNGEGEPGQGEGGDQGGADPGGGPDDLPGPTPPGSSAGSQGEPADAGASGSAAVPGSGVSSGRSPRGNSPADRLARAVESIRDARDRRLPDLPPTRTSSPDRPRW